MFFFLFFLNTVKYRTFLTYNRFEEFQESFNCILRVVGVVEFEWNVFCDSIVEFAD